MTDRIDVYEARKRLHSISGSVIRNLLPEMRLSYRSIDLDRLTNSLAAISGGRLDKDDARSPLRWFFNKAKTSNVMDLPRQVKDHLLGMLWRSMHMRKIRKHFVTMAYLSVRGRSNRIAEHLVEFFRCFSQYIIARDYDRLDDWEAAIKALRSLTSTTRALQKLNQGRYQPPHYYHHARRYPSPPYSSGSDSEDAYGIPRHWERGRDRNRNDHHHCRAQTMPPMYCTPVPQIATPDYLALPPSRGIMSGFPSPSLFTHDFWQETRLENMWEQQQMLMERMEQLTLEHRALEDEVQDQQAEAYGPLMLTG